MKRPAPKNKRGGFLQMAFRARKVFGAFEKRAPGVLHVMWSLQQVIHILVQMEI